MFVDRSRLLTQGAAFVLVAAATAACTDPTLRTDLRPEGAPEVLTVLVMNDPVDGFVETATFCKVNDDKRPGLVPTNVGPLQVCVDDLSKPAGYDEIDLTNDTKMFVEAKVEDAVPVGWYARVQFDELLNPDVEQLVDIPDDMGNPSGQQEGHIMNTLPVTLKCGGVDVPYDGYYSPSGNNVTWPVGPSLYIAPADFVATGAECTIQVKDVIKDKDGVSAPALEAPASWHIGALELSGSTPEGNADPAAPDEDVDPAAPAILSFNAPIDAATLAASEVKLEELPAGSMCDVVAGTTPRTAVVTADPDDPQSLDIADSMPGMAGLAFEPLKFYRITFVAAAVADAAGGPGMVPDDLVLCFTTSAAM